MRKDGSFIKVERLAQIRKQVSSQFPKPVPFDKLQLWVECNIGLGEQKAREYIEKAVASAGWIIVEGEILVDAGQ